MLLPWAAWLPVLYSKDGISPVDVHASNGCFSTSIGSVQCNYPTRSKPRLRLCFLVLWQSPPCIWAVPWRQLTTNPIRLQRARAKHARTMTAGCNYPPVFAQRCLLTRLDTRAKWWLRRAEFFTSTPGRAGTTATTRRMQVVSW